MTDAERHRGADQADRGSGSGRRARKRRHENEVVVGGPRELTDEAIDEFADDMFRALMDASTEDRDEGDDR